VPLIWFVGLAWLALVFAFQFVQLIQQLRTCADVDLGWLCVEQFVAAQRQRLELVDFVIVLDRARRLRVDRPRRVRRRARGELTPSCRRTDIRGGIQRVMLNRALARPRDFSQGF
jgi:hypothetical protein